MIKKGAALSFKTQTLLIAKTTIDFFDRADTQSLSDGQGAQYETVLPEFKVVEMLGEGGMGQVFLAQQSAPERGVAVKRLRVGLTMFSFSNLFSND